MSPVAADNKYNSIYYAPAYNPSPERKKQHKQTEQTKKTKLEKVPKTKIEKLIYEEKKTNRKFVKIISVFGIFAVMFAFVCHSNSIKDQAKQSLYEAKDTYSFYATTNKELDAKLNQIVLPEMIQEYATNELKLIKINPETIIYVDTREGNEVLLYQDKK